MLELDYQPFYCEENIWKLCDRGVIDGSLIDGSLVVFISNAHGEVLLCQQRAGDPQHGIVAWDYHVILAVPTKAGWQIHDLDTRLGLPCLWPSYRSHTFPTLPPEFARWTPSFRTVPADVYHQHFASDRSHMRRADGSWMQPPPDWPTIGEDSNLMRFIDLEDDFLGDIVDLDSLLVIDPS